MSTAGATVLALGYAMPVFYLIYSLKYGEVAGDNPWGAVGLEWETTSPPPLHNFESMPVVDFEPYHYHQGMHGAPAGAHVAEATPGGSAA